jgi:hypothetical protein
MRKGRIVVLLLAVVLGLAMTAALVAYAQEPETEEPEGNGSGQVVDFGIKDPPPAGYTVLYMFTGARVDPSAQHKAATSVHCANYGTASANVLVELFDWNVSLVMTGTATIPPDEMRTFSSHDTYIYRNEIIIGPNPQFLSIDQGSGRVMATQPNLICTAQVFGPSNITPTYMVNLDLFQP